MRIFKTLPSTPTGILSVLLALLVLGPTSQAAAQVEAASLAEAFSWREIGPANPGGRITDVEGVESAPQIYYVGTATGGVWKTVNAGITFEPIFDDQPNASIGDIGLSRSDPNVLYVGTGRPTTGTALRGERGCSRAPMAERAGPTSVLPRPGTSPGWWCTPPIPTSSMSRPWATCGVSTRSAASTRRLTGAPRGTRSST